MGSNYSYQLPRQACGTSQIHVNPTQVRYLLNHPVAGTYFHSLTTFCRNNCLSESCHSQESNLIHCRPLFRCRPPFATLAAPRATGATRRASSTSSATAGRPPRSSSGTRTSARREGGSRKRYGCLSVGRQVHLL